MRLAVYLASSRIRHRLNMIDSDEWRSRSVLSDPGGGEQ
jgi:hypothetical protein